MGLYELLYYLVGIGLIILNYFIAKNLNTNHRKKFLNHQDYVWGYMQGVGAMIFGTVYGLFYLYLLISLSVELLTIVIVFALFSITVILGYLICKKSKQAIIWATVFSLNPVIWIINFFYIKNRRGDFFEQEKQI
tara:strand:- start:585 stop:989 length:405 start_codon:yes stop_codon:yes gene_type:complete